MGKAKRTQDTPEFRQEAVRLVDSGQSIATAARSLGMVEKTLDNWVRARRAGTLKAVGNKPTVSAEQMENSRLRAELARVTMERDIFHPTVENLSVVLSYLVDCRSHLFNDLELTRARNFTFNL